MGSVTNWVIGREPARATGAALAVPVRVPWYRSLPLASVERLSLTVDGREVPDADVRLDVNGRTHAASELIQHPDEFWFVQDTAWALVPAGDLGDTAEVTVAATFRIPYIFVGPDTPLRREVAETRTLDVVREA